MIRKDQERKETLWNLGYNEKTKCLRLTMLPLRIPPAFYLEGGIFMTFTMPEGTTVRKAIQWISKMREEGGIYSLSNLIDQACVRFNLSPKDCDFVHRFFREAEGAQTGKK
jgi:hypothetical protein